MDLPVSSLFSPPSNSDVASVPSLSDVELNQIRSALGPTSSILATSVVKLYMCARGAAEYTYSGLWGALVLIVDRTPPTCKMIRIYRMHPAHDHTTTAMECVFSFQIYECMTYLSLNHLFHTFEIDGGLIGLSFGDANESHQFLVKVRAHIPPHGTVMVRPQKKPGLLARIFRRSGSVTPPHHQQQQSPHTSSMSISTPTHVVKHELPEEWSTLFKNAATHIANQQNKNGNRT